MQQFLGSVNYIGGHLPHLATLEAPLTELTGNASWEWGPLQQRSFDQVKEICRTHVPLAPINYAKVMQVDPAITPPEGIFLVTDASKVGVGSFICHGKNYTAAKSKVAATAIFALKTRE